MSSTPKRILLAFHWYSEALHEGAVKYCVEHGWSASVLNADSADSFPPGSFAGIVGGLPEPGNPVHELAVRSGVPVVELSYSYPENKLWARCPSDCDKVGRMAAEHLARRPVASFAFVAYMERPTDVARAEGFHNGLAAVGDARPFQKHFIWTPKDEAGPDAASGYLSEPQKTRLAEFLKSQPLPVGVFASVDEHARLVYEATVHAGLKVPGDVYLMGFGTRDLITRIAPVPITSIDIDRRAWAYAAVGLLDDLMSERIPPGTIRPFPPCGVVVRESTGGESAGDPLCARALELMNAHIAEPLEVTDLATRLGTSPSSLKRAFNATFGEGVAAHYLTLRLEVAKGLLAAGNKVEGVAAEVGFASPRAFRTAFEKATGMSPGAFSSKIKDTGPPKGNARTSRPGRS